MKILFRIFAAVLFILFFGFALKNTQEVSLLFFMGHELRQPLVLFLLAFFIGGAILGVLAMTPTVFRHRRETMRLKKIIAAMQKENQAKVLASTQPPQPDAVVSI